MLKLKKLTFSGIGRFVEEQVIDFTNLNSLIQIDAHNSITGGSSGSGKSTIFNALDWLFGISDLSTNTLQSRLTKISLSVSGEFDWNDKQVIIHRSKKLSITIDSLEITGSSKISEEKLDEIIGMPRHLFRVLLHKRQGETGFFLLMTPSKMNDFLIDALDLSIIRSKIDLSDIKIKELEQAKTKTEIDLQATLGAIEAIKQSYKSIGDEPIAETTEELVNQYKIKFDSIKIDLETIKSNHKLEKIELESNRPNIFLHQFNRVIRGELEKEEKEINNQIDLIFSKEKERQDLIDKEISKTKLDSNNQIYNLKLENSRKITENKDKFIKLDQVVKSGKNSRDQALKISEQLKKLKNGICQTCEQSWLTEKSKEEEKRLLKDLEQCKLDIEAAFKADIEMKNLEPELSSIIESYNILISDAENQSNMKIATLKNQLEDKILVFDLPLLNEKLRIICNQKIEENLKEDTFNKEQYDLHEKEQKDFLLKLKELSEKHQQELNSISMSFEQAKNDYEKHNYLLKSYSDSLTRYQISLESIKKNEAEYFSKIEHMNQKLIQTKQDLEIAEEVKRCLKLYISCSFDDALTSISDTATTILRSIPTMTNATIRLEGTKETNSGAIKEQVTAVVDSDGELDIPLRSLSGGEKSAVDLSIDLAVCEMIQEKTNKGIDITCLDEPFNGLDSIGIEYALEMLKSVSNIKKILLVEHDGIAKEFIQDRIIVIRDGETSYLK